MRTSFSKKIGEKGNGISQQIKKSIKLTLIFSLTSDPNSGSSVDWVYQILGIPYTYIIEMVPYKNLTLKMGFMSPPSLMRQNCKDIFIGIETMALNLKL